MDGSHLKIPDIFDKYRNIFRKYAKNWQIISEFVEMAGNLNKKINAFANSTHPRKGTETLVMHQLTTSETKNSTHPRKGTETAMPRKIFCKI